MPETRISETLASLVQSVADLSSRTQALEALRVEDCARLDAKYDRIMALLEGMDRRAGKQANQQSGESSSNGLLPTPIEQFAPAEPTRQQQVLMPAGGSGGCDGGTLMKSMRIDVPTFSGEAVEGWLFQMERYFAHNRVPEDQKMTLATFYLSGEALRWFQWLHTTHQVREWTDFVTDVKRRFGPSVYYSAEALINKLNQTGNVASYITEFESLSTRTPGLTHDNLLHRFVAGLKDEIHNEIVLLCPNNLQAAMGMARVAEQKVHSGKWHVSRPPDVRSSFSQHGASAGPRPEHIPQVNSSALPVKRLTPAEMAARRERGLCFNCEDKFTPGHRCKPQFQCMLLEDDVNDSEDVEEPSNEENSRVIVPAISYHAMQGRPVPRTLRLAADLAGRQVMVLVDSGSTHNFLQSRVARSAGLIVEATRHLSVTVGNGDELQCDGVCRDVPLLLGGKEFRVDFHLLPIYGVDAVLGAQWLADVGPVCFDFKDLWMSLVCGGEQLVLHGQEPHAQFASLTLGQLRRVTQKGAVMSMFQLTVAMAAPDGSMESHSLPEISPEMPAHQQPLTNLLCKEAWVRSPEAEVVYGSPPPTLMDYTTGDSKVVNVDQLLTTPFEVLARVGKVAYKVALPEGGKVHNAFHISVMKKWRTNPPFAHIDWPDCFIHQHPALVPDTVLATRLVQRGDLDVPQLMVKWKGHEDDDATREDADSLLRDYPQFNLEDKVVFGGGTNDAQRRRVVKEEADQTARRRPEQSKEDQIRHFPPEEYTLHVCMEMEEGSSSLVESA
ncbi:unnamed protein product [Rhodiola kirilowii]